MPDILLATDAPWIADEIQAALGDADTVIHVVNTGAEVIGKARDLHPDIVITDIHMPHMDGFEMVRQLSANELIRPQTLIAVSASSPQEVAVLGQLPDDVQLLTKPLDQALVIATLRRAATGS